jgi:hypothetical protein
MPIATTITGNRIRAAATVRSLQPGLRHQVNQPAAAKFLSAFIRGKILVPSTPAPQASPCLICVAVPER